MPLGVDGCTYNNFLDKSNFKKPGMRLHGLKIFMVYLKTEKVTECRISNLTSVKF